MRFSPTLSSGPTHRPWFFLFFIFFFFFSFIFLVLLPIKKDIALPCQLVPISPYPLYRRPCYSASLYTNNNNSSDCPLSV